MSGFLKLCDTTLRLAFPRFGVVPNSTMANPYPKNFTKKKKERLEAKGMGFVNLQAYCLETHEERKACDPEYKPKVTDEFALAKIVSCKNHVLKASKELRNAYLSGVFGALLSLGKNGADLEHFKKALNITARHLALFEYAYEGLEKEKWVEFSDDFFKIQAVVDIITGRANKSDLDVDTLTKGLKDDVNTELELLKTVFKTPDQAQQALMAMTGIPMEYGKDDEGKLTATATESCISLAVEDLIRVPVCRFDDTKNCHASSIGLSQTPMFTEQYCLRNEPLAPLDIWNNLKGRNSGNLPNALNVMQEQQDRYIDVINILNFKEEKFDSKKTIDQQLEELFKKLEAKVNCVILLKNSEGSCVHSFQYVNFEGKYRVISKNGISTESEYDSAEVVKNIFEEEMEAEKLTVQLLYTPVEVQKKSNKK